jgi:hypothetical protein
MQHPIGRSQGCRDGGLGRLVLAGDPSELGLGPLGVGSLGGDHGEPGDGDLERLVRR